jgi:hypothetical protein
MTDKASFPKDFVAQMMILGEPGPSVPLLEWFMVEFRDSAGYCGFGCTRQEMELPENARAQRLLVLAGSNMKSCLSGGKLFSNLSSLEGAKAFINSFCYYSFVEQSILTYIFEGYAQDVRLNRWEYFTGVVEAFLLKMVSVNRCVAAWYKRGDEFLIGHAMLYLLELMWRAEINYEPKCYHVIGCLMFIKEHDDNVFLHQNSALSTLVDIVLTEGDTLCALADVTKETEIPTYQFILVRALVKESPDACLLRNDKGQLPIHAAFDLQDHVARNACIHLLRETCPGVAERRCTSTGLYPFQLAAAMNTKSTFDCCCSSCSSQKTDMSLSNIYSLLRLCPTLIADGIPSESKLSNKLCIEVAMKNLALSRKRVLVDRMTRELFDAEMELSIKQERLDELGEKDESDEEEEECEDDEEEEECEDDHGNEDDEDESSDEEYDEYLHIIIRGLLAAAYSS